MIRYSIYKNDNHEKHMTTSNIIYIFTWLKENYGTNTAMIQHNKASQIEQEHWIVPIKENTFTIINLDS